MGHSNLKQNVKSAQKLKKKEERNCVKFWFNKNKLDNQ